MCSSDLPNPKPQTPTSVILIGDISLYLTMESDGSSVASIGSFILPTFDNEPIHNEKPDLIDKKNYQKPGDQRKHQKNNINNRIKGQARGKGEEKFEMFSKGYKTVPCEFFLKGHCQKGDDCKFRHDVEQKQLDLICKFFLAGSCTNSKCLYLHDTSKYPCKFLYVSGKCDKMTECKFSHARFTSIAQIEDFVKQNLDSLKVHRDKGITSTVLKYAIEKGHLKQTAELERQEKMGLIPPGLYEDSESDDEKPESGKHRGGQISGDIRKREQPDHPKISQEPEMTKSTDIFMP